MPRQFNFRRDFPQLNREVKTKEQLINEITVEDIEELLNFICMECIVEVDEESVRKETGYTNRVKFKSSPIEEDSIGVLKYFLDDTQGNPYISGEIYIEGEAKPMYVARLRLDISPYTHIGQEIKYVKRYGARLWDRKD